MIPIQKRSRSRTSQLFLNACLLIVAGCASRGSSNNEAGNNSLPPTEVRSVDIRDNALALLQNLLNDEKNLSKVLLIKWESDELDQIVKEISKIAGAGVELIRSMEKGNSILEHSGTGLPAGEVAAREAIAKLTRDELLKSRGADFELKLLLTQVQALRYGSQLAWIVAENDTQPDRILEYKKLSVQLKMLGEQVVALIRKGQVKQSN